MRTQSESEVPKLEEDVELASVRLRSHALRKQVMGFEEALGLTPKVGVMSSCPCDALLTGGVFQRTRISTDESIRLIWENFLYHRSYEEVKSDNSLDLGLIELTIGANFSKKSFEEWKQNYKGSFEKEFSYSMLIEKADKDLLDSYNQCIRDRCSNGVFVSLESDAGEDDDVAEVLVARVSYRAAPKQPSTVTLTEVQVVGAKPIPLASGELGLLFSKGPTVENGGSLTGQVRREGTTKKRPEVRLTVNTDLGASDVAMVPALEVPVYEDRWFDEDESGHPYAEAFRYTGPDCDANKGHKGRTITKRFRLSNQSGYIRSVQCKGIKGPTPWDSGARIDIDPDRRGFSTRRNHGSTPTTYEYTARYSVKRRVRVS